MDEWISIKQAAQLTGYSTEHIRELARNGRVKSRKVVTIWQIEKSDLLKYQSEHERERGEESRVK